MNQFFDFARGMNPAIAGLAQGYKLPFSHLVQIWQDCQISQLPKAGPKGESTESTRVIPHGFVPAASRGEISIIFKIKNSLVLDLFLSIIIFLGLAIPVQSYAAATKPKYSSHSHKQKKRKDFVATEEEIITISSIDDPDGDGDTKGANYFPRKREATGNKVFIFDPNHKSWAIYDPHGYRLNTGKASGGKYYCPDVGRGCKTISGTFKIFSMGGAGCISNKYPINAGGGAPMPYCMFFYGGYAIHGSPDVPNRNASHGCIRITPTVAKWLNQNFMEIGTTVILRPYK